MKKSLAILAFASLLPVLPATAQNANQDPAAENQTKESNGPHRFWQASLPGGHYMVAIDRIASISMHQYVLDAQLLVDEVVIDTNGRGLARFYYVSSVAESSGSGTASRIAAKGRELVERAGQRSGSNIHELAQKNYPTTSHAGMVEYRILNRADLDALYQSLKNAWESGKGRKLTVQ